jgi:hypothetical protein
MSSPNSQVEMNLNIFIKNVQKLHEPIDGISLELAITDPRKFRLRDAGFAFCGNRRSPLFIDRLSDEIGHDCARPVNIGLPAGAFANTIGSTGEKVLFSHADQT